MYIYETEICYMNQKSLIDQWDSVENALNFFNISIDIDNCTFAKLSSIESDGSGHFGENGYDLIAEYTAGIGIQYYKRKEIGYGI